MSTRKCALIWKLLVLVMVLILAPVGCTGKTPVPTVEPEAIDTPDQVSPTVAEPSLPTPEPLEEGPVSGGTLVIGSPSDAVTLDPQDAPEVESTLRSELVGECLARLKPESLEVDPWLAESWEILDEGLRWRFHLRENIQFHDGTPFNADAVEFSFMRMLDENHDYNQYGTWRLSLSTFKSIADVKAIDDFTVDFTLKNPFPAFITAMGSGSRCSIVSPTAVQADPENFSQHPIGTGPFKFVEWRTDDRVVFERNESYWMTPPYLERVIFRVIPESTARFLSLQQGEIQMMYGMDPTIAELVDLDPDLLLSEHMGILHSYLALNHLNEYLSDVRVRQALYHAIDREALVEAFWSGATVAQGVMPPSLLGFHDGLTWPEYNPEKAKELLEEAGYADGFDLNLITFNAARTHTPEPSKTGEAIQAYLAEVGIRVEVQILEIATLLTQCKNAQCDLYLTGFQPLIADPWTIIYTQFDSRRTELGAANNYAFYRNPELDALNDLADLSTDDEERAEIYRQAQEIIYRDMVRVDIADGNVILGLRQEVKGFTTSPIATLYLESTWLDK